MWGTGAQISGTHTQLKNIEIETLDNRPIPHMLPAGAIARCFKTPNATTSRHYAATRISCIVETFAAKYDPCSHAPWASSLTFQPGQPRVPCSFRTSRAMLHLRVHEFIDVPMQRRPCIHEFSTCKGVRADECRKSAVVHAPFHDIPHKFFHSLWHLHHALRVVSTSPLHQGDLNSGIQSCSKQPLHLAKFANSMMLYI